MSPTLEAGVTRTEPYEALLASPAFSEMESFSAQFLRANRAALARYARRWVKDPLHQWSRLWEYPFVFEKLGAHSRPGAGGELRLLDAGSGLTFFPSYLVAKLPGAVVSCCDYDAKSAADFARFTTAARERVSFEVASLQKLPYADASMEGIYSISVLEHTADYDRILEEFERILVPGGTLVITFDISLDGRSEIDPAGARRLLASLDRRFRALEAPTPERFDAALSAPDLLTTGFTRRTRPALLPWQRTWRTDLSTLARLRQPRTQYFELAVCCGVWARREG
jgi:SAM-dependent methyltransferase